MDKKIESFDGETINNNYVLLGNSKDYIFNKNGLSIKKCLEFLFNYGETYNYFFRMHYDLNMIFSKTSKEKCLLFFDSEEICIYNYNLLYYPNKILIIKRGRRTKKYFDISNFFKASFLKTIDILKIDLSENEKFILNKYKKLRSSFSLKQKKNIIEYNKIECQINNKIVEKIYTLIPDNLKSYSLYGSSALSQKFLRKNNINVKINPFGIFYNKKLNDVLISSYFGGRAECFKVGKFHNLYKYDIVSAYPSIIKNLRVVTDIKLNKKPKKIIVTNLYLIELEIEKPEFIGLLPLRLKSNLLVFPDKVKGWFYGYEVLQVKKYSEKYSFVKLKIIDEIKFILSGRLFSNNQIEKLFKKRIELKNKKDLQNYIYKILLNSIYGKFAQQVGNPVFQNFYYAGLITSYCRSELLKYSINNWKDIIFYATDCLLSKKEIKNIPVGNKLGMYEKIKIKTGVVVLSGVYYLTDYNNNFYTGERGYRIDFKKAIPEINKTGKFSLINNLFITNKYAFKNYKSFGKKRCKFTNIKKTIDIKHQLKRKYCFYSFDNYLNCEFSSILLDNKDLNILNNLVIFDNIDLDLMENYF